MVAAAGVGVSAAMAYGPFPATAPTTSVVLGAAAPLVDLLDV